LPSNVHLPLPLNEKEKEDINQTNNPNISSQEDDFFPNDSSDDDLDDPETTEESDPKKIKNER
jgi:hypothetical protein